MKLKGIAALCKKNKWANVFQEYGNDTELVQYIGDGTAFYQVNNLPNLDKESLLTIFEIPEKQWGSWLVQVNEIPAGIDFSDATTEERVVQQLEPAIIYNEKTLLPLQTQKGIVFLDSKYLLPLSDVLDILSLFERKTKTGQTYIVAKAGLMLKAVIAPKDIITTRFIEQLEELAKECACSLSQKEKEQTVRIDTTTGEII